MDYRNLMAPAPTKKAVAKTYDQDYNNYQDPNDQNIYDYSQPQHNNDYNNNNDYYDNAAF